MITNSAITCMTALQSQPDTGTVGRKYEVHLTIEEELEEVAYNQALTSMILKLLEENQWQPKKLTLTAMGMALFVMLSLCVQVPVFENYYLCLGYMVLMVFCCYFGRLPTLEVGTLGVVLY